MQEREVLTILHKHLPDAAVDYCHSLWKASPFHLKITNSRHSKAGDFYCSNKQEIPRITLNNDLNPYLFLLTYVHEVAHLYVFNQHNRNIAPHGREWKHTFQQLLQPLLQPAFFPEPALTLLIRHMQNPKASSFADAALTKALRSFDPKAVEDITVSDLPEGSLFVLRGKHFKKGKLRRTRFLCHEIKSKRQYLVPAEALVEKVQLSLGLF